MILSRKYNLDIVPGKHPQIFRVSRGDSSSLLVFTLYASEGVLDIPDTAAVVIRSAVSETECSLVFFRGEPMVYAPLTRGLTSQRGMIPVELVLTDGGISLITATFYLDVR